MSAVTEGIDAFRVSDELGAVLALAGADHVGPAAVRVMIDRYGGPLEALDAASDAPELSKGQKEGVAAALADRSVERAAREAAAAAEDGLRTGDRLVGYGLPGYPARLQRLHFPPPVLWARGPLPVDSARAVAIVGTRTATRPARDLARGIARELATDGVRIISGLAAGVDGCAHRGALGASGETAAVLGSGLKFRYPSANHDLYARLSREGLILTEFAPDVRPEGHNFPRRNRIVAALSDGVLVVQAGRRSGALLTAREAADIGVEVMACPGDPRLPGSVGCHGLLRDGAGLVTCATDVMRILGWNREAIMAPGAAPHPRTPELGEAERALVERLEREPAVLDELAELAGGIRPATALLARLEMAGVVRGLPGGRWGRLPPERTSGR